MLCIAACVASAAIAQTKSSEAPDGASQGDPLCFISSVVPDSAHQGDDLWVAITGTGTYFAQGSGTIVSFFQQGSSTYTITAAEVNPTSYHDLTAHFLIPSNALLGLYDVKVEEVGIGTYSMSDGFTVLEGMQPECGDVNGDGNIDPADLTFLINFVFLQGPIPDPIEFADVDCDGKINLLDVVYMVRYLFRGGPAPCADCLQ
jgi:hypothetical protein